MTFVDTLCSLEEGWPGAKASEAAPVERDPIQPATYLDVAFALR